MTRMDEKKQIEEMAKTICDICRPKTDCANGKICTMAYLEAEGLYKEGFRKKDEILYRIEVEIREMIPKAPMDKMAMRTVYDMACEKTLYAVLRRLDELRSLI